MNELSSWQSCICRKMQNLWSLCEGEHCFSEQGKKLKCSTKPSETVVAMVLDGCVFSDNKTKCDGLFLFNSAHKKAICLVELKGSDIPHAFEQLAFVKKNRLEYQHIKQAFNKSSTGKLSEKAFIVSNAVLSKVVQEQLENAHGIRVSAILHSEATTPIPDIRRYL